MADLDFLDDLYEVIKSRKDGNHKKSYTAKLFHRGRGKMAQKVGEEAVELVIEAVANKRKKAISESADLLFHLFVLWSDMGISLEDVVDALKERKGTSGIEEKKSRKD